MKGFVYNFHVDNGFYQQFTPLHYGNNLDCSCSDDEICVETIFNCVEDGECQSGTDCLSDEGVVPTGDNSEGENPNEPTPQEHTLSAYDGIPVVIYNGPDSEPWAMRNEYQDLSPEIMDAEFDIDSQVGMKNYFAYLPSDAYEIWN